jgi:2'-5' RNA ligase
VADDRGSVLGTTPVPAPPADGVISVGIAIPVPHPYRDTLRSARLGVGDPQGHVVPPHVTLLPPTQVRLDALPGIRDHHSGVGSRVAPFSISLRGTGTFRPVSPVVFVNVVAGGDDCDLLQQQIRRGVLTRPLQFSYHPHVTIAHGLSDATLDRARDTMAEFSASFEVTAFGLYWFDAAGTWTVDTIVALSARTVSE